MVSLSEERINASSPYKVSLIEGKNCVIFKTDYGVEYIVGFDATEVLQTAETYQFYITNINNKKSPRDGKLRETLNVIVWDFLLSSNTAIIYICETGDGRQALRNRLFNYWISESPYYSRIATVSGGVVDEEGIENYASLIVRNDHPQLVEVTTEFLSTIKLLNQKPTQ